MPLLFVQGLNNHIAGMIVFINIGLSLYILFTILIKKKSFVFDYTDILITVFFLYCVLRGCFSNKYVDPSFFLKWSIFLNCYLAFQFFGLQAKKIVWWIFVSVGFVQSIIVLLQLCAVVPSRNPFFEVSGTFRNPAPTALCIAITFLLLLRKTIICFNEKENKGVVTSFFSLLVIFGISLFACDSRTAFFSCVVALLICIDKATGAFKKIRHKAVLFLTVVVLFLCGLFFVRPNSAMSRIAIWWISLKDCKSNIFFGKGPTSFPSCYQLAQEKYFRENPESIFLPYSDEHFHPFNELVHIVYEEGIVGLFIVGLIFISAINKKDLWSKEVLICVTLASFFIYVSEMTFVMICLACSMSREMRMVEFNTKNTIALSSVQVLSVFFSIMFIILNSNSRESHPEDIFFEQELAKSYITNNISVNSKLISELEYEGLSSDNIQKYVFLTEKCPTYDKYCMLGKYFSEENLKHEAEKYYLKAMNLIPTRIGPVYELFNLYRQSDPDKAAGYARIIESRRDIYSKRIKTYSRQMEINKWLESYKNVF